MARTLSISAMATLEQSLKFNRKNSQENMHAQKHFEDVLSESSHMHKVRNGNTEQMRIQNHTMSNI